MIDYLLTMYNSFDKKKLMFALLILWGIVIFFRLTFFSTKQQTGIPLKYQPKNTKTKDVKEKIGYPVIAEIKLGQLNNSKIKYQENFKNIFKPLYIPEEKPSPKPAPPKPSPPPPPKHNPLEDEMKKFQFIGFSKDKKDTRIFLSKNDNLYVIKKGENIEEKFLIKDVTQTEIIITLINEPEIEFRIKLKEEEQSSINYSRQPVNPAFNEPPNLPVEEPPQPPQEEQFFKSPEEPQDIRPDSPPHPPRPIRQPPLPPVEKDIFQPE